MNKQKITPIKSDSLCKDVTKVMSECTHSRDTPLTLTYFLTHTDNLPKEITFSNINTSPILPKPLLKKQLEKLTNKLLENSEEINNPEE